MGTQLTRHEVLDLYFFSELQKLGSDGDRSQFISSLSPPAKDQLVAMLSGWRKNGIDQVLLSPRWERLTARIDQIRIGPINTKTNEVLAKIDHRLHRLDEIRAELLTLNEFDLQSSGMAERPLIATRRGITDFELKDGNHRGVVQALNGASKLDLVVPF